MPESEYAAAVSHVQKALKPRLKELGFRLRGRTWNRTSPDGLTQVINFQMGSSDPPGTTYIPGLRENLYGLFTVNLGIYVPEVAAAHGGGEAKSWVQDYHCSLRSRLGRLAEIGKDTWWRATAASDVVADIAKCIEVNALPFFERFATRDKIIAECALEPDRCSEFGGPPRIVCAIILSTKGALGKARELLQAQSLDGHNPGHPAYVRQLAKRIGVGELDG